MRRIIKTLSLVILMAVTAFLCATAFAQGSGDYFLKKRAEGWFWYETEPEPEEPPKIIPKPESDKQKKTPETTVKNDEKKPEPLSVEWFQKEYQKLMQKAVDDPSEENVRKYRYATRVMLDKATNFANVFKKESLLDPLLDESVRSPFSSAMRGSFMRWSMDQKKKATEAISKKAGIWVFLDDKCPFCALQYPIIARTVKERGFEAIYITPDGKKPSWMKGGEDVRKDIGQSKVLRIGIRPAIALVVPPEKITVLTQGLLSQDLLEERILVAGDAAGLISGQERKDAFPEERGLLTPEDIKAIGKQVEKNPDSLTNNVQKSLEKRY